MAQEWGWVVWDTKNVDTIVVVSSTEKEAKYRLGELLGKTSKKLKVQRMAWDKAFLLWEHAVDNDLKGKK